MLDIYSPIIIVIFINFSGDDSLHVSIQNLHYACITPHIITHVYKFVYNIILSRKLLKNDLEVK